MIGLSNPMYQVGADAMLADMIPSEKRTDAYAINRIANNAAFAIGPAVGGFLAATSYDLAFIGASTGFLIYSVLLFLLAHETLDKSAHETPAIAAGPGRIPTRPEGQTLHDLCRHHQPWADRAHHAVDPDARLRQDQLRHPRKPVRLDPHHQRPDVRLHPILRHAHHAQTPHAPRPDASACSSTPSARAAWRS
ncbi:MAG: MFS transporter [Candidatus Moduliflexus flocculans]|nr:MFS transporter [Candidatus Moduliflexus flocculans]